jgi:hypothetical protein
MTTETKHHADAGRHERGVRPLPQPGAWVAQLGGDSEYPQIAKVREAHPYADALDLIFYSSAGERVGRVSPAMGGPTGFEPFCGAEFWVEIQTPRFAEIAEARYGWRELLTPLRPNIRAEAAPRP